MKKLVALVFLFFGLSVQAQSNYYWTNAVVIYTNLTFGSLTVPLTSNGYFSLSWAADQDNANFNLSGTNRFKVKDEMARAVFERVESAYVQSWQAALQAQADAKATIRKIKEQLNSMSWTETQLSNACVSLGLSYP